MKPADAVRHLRRAIRKMPDVPTAEAIAVLIEHVQNLEGKLDLLRSAMTSVFQTLPESAVFRQKP